MEKLNETVQVTLTAEEVAFLEQKREEKRLAEEHAEAEKAAKYEKAKAVVKERIAKYCATEDAQVKATEEFFKGFKEPWNLHIVRVEENVEEKTYSSGSSREVLYSETYTKRKAFIYYEDGEQFYIRIQPVYGESRIYTRGQFKGYKMYVVGPGFGFKYTARAMTSAKSVMDKVTNRIEEVRREKEAAERAQQGQSTAFAELQKEFPNAAGIERRKTSEKTWQNVYIEITLAVVTFKNGVKIEFRLYDDGSIGRHKISFPRIKDTRGNEAQFMLARQLESLTF